MASNKTRTRTIRIANDTADYFENMPLNRIVECVHALLESGKLEFDGEEVSLTEDNGVHAENPVSESWKDALSDIETMAELSGGTVESLIDALERAMNEGEILFDGEELVFTLPEWAEKIREACHDRCVTEEAFGKKIVEMINRGQI